MPFTRTHFLRIIKVSCAIMIVLIIAGYALWRSLAYARGPAIVLTEPTDFASITSTTTHVIGSVERANNITLNGRAISIDEQGNFNETIVVFPGTNVLTLEARDQFDRKVQTQIRLTRIQ